jgi:hypothetical protein
MIASQVPREYSVRLHELICRRRFNINPITVPALKLLRSIKESFLSTYHPDAQTRKKIDMSIQEIHSILLRKAMRQISVSSLRVILYLFLRDPVSSMRTLIRSGQRVVQKALHLRRERKLPETPYERTE